MIELDDMRYKRVMKWGKFGFSDESGKIIIPCQWEDASLSYEGLASVQGENGRYAYIEKTVISPCQWKVAYIFEDGVAVVCDSNNNWLELGRNGLIIGPYVFS